MVYFKNGKISVKTYEHLCPNSMIYIKKGTYIFKPREELIFIDDPSEDGYWFNNVVSLPFYINLDVDFRREQDNCIPLTLDRRGIFHRTDGIFGQASISDLFCKYDEGGEK